MTDAPETLSRESEIREALRAVMDPEIGLNIIELGLIRDVAVNDDNVHLTMILTTPFCPYGPQLIEQTRMVAEQAAGMTATVELGSELWDPSMMEEGAGGDWGLF